MMFGLIRIFHAVMIGRVRKESKLSFKFKEGNKMFATELIGKRAIRTKPVRYPNGVEDRSYTDGSPVKIINATADNIVIKSGIAKNSEWVLSAPFTDDNWTDYDELIKPPEKKLRNLVFVKHENSSKQYLFEVPEDVQLYKGEKVFCETVWGQSFGVCDTDSVLVEPEIAKFIISGCGAYEPIKPVIGYAEEKKNYELRAFGIPF
jgi:hypothetical protein